MKFQKCNPDTIPPRLRETGRFCLWRNENGRKIPYNPKTGGKAQPNNPDTFSNYQTAAAKAGAEYTGMGIGIFGTLAAIDIDHCIQGGQLSPMAAKIVKIMDSYTERSPSGDGIHILFTAPGLKFDTGKYYTKNSGAGLEIYIAGMTSRYMTITGDIINNADIEERMTAVQEVIHRYMERPQVERERSAPPARDGAGISLSDSDLIARAKTAKNGNAFSALWDGDTTGYQSQSEADQALCNILAFWTGGNEAQIDQLFRQSGLMRDKWELDGYRERTIGTAIARCENFYTPRKEPFVQNVPETRQDAQGAKKVNNVNTSITKAENAVSRQNDGSEKQRDHSSEELFDGFREMEIVDTLLNSVQTEAYKPIKTGMDAFDRLLGGGFDPQTLVMIGGAPGMGKTAFTQQVFETMAAHGRKVVFFNFEMSREQLIARSISRTAKRAGHTISAVEFMRGYQWTEEQRAYVIEAAEKYRDSTAFNMHYNPNKVLPTVGSVKQFLDKSLKWAKETNNPAPVIVLDYLQLILPEGNQDVKETIKLAIKILKDYAIAGNTVSCAILAFNRNSNAAGKVTMESGRDTSAIEYAADVMLGINDLEIEAPSMAQDLKDRDGCSKICLKLLKKRMSPPDIAISMYFDGNSSMFAPVGNIYKISRYVARKSTKSTEHTQEDEERAFGGSDAIPLKRNTPIDLRQVKNRKN